AHCTLVLAVPTCEGFVIVSDKLRHSGELGYAEDTKKLLPLGDSAVAAFTGTVGMVETENRAGSRPKERLFAREFVEAYFRSHPVDPSAFSGLATYLRLSTADYLGHFQPLNLPTTEGADLFQVVILRVAAPNRFFCHTLKFRYALLASRLDLTS